MALKLVPWESWHIWNEVRKAVFSTAPNRVTAALNKISAWRARNSLPVAVEVTWDLISIQRTDPYFFSGSSCPESAVTDEMLSLMYAMAIMRLINGVVDQSKKQNSSSVAARAESAGLPRMLVDIRHEVAHQELPSLSYLQLASKEALEWLKVHYWEAQKQVLDDVHKHSQAKLHAYASLSETPQSKALMHVRGVRKRTMRHRAKKLVMLKSPVIDLFGESNDFGTTEMVRENAMTDAFKEIICNDELIDAELQKSQRALSRAKKRLRSFYKSNESILYSKGDLDGEAPFDTVDSSVPDFSRTNVSQKTKDGNAKNLSNTKGVWSLAENWRPCAIGMLPSKIRSAGVLPQFPGLASEASTCEATVKQSRELEADISTKEDIVGAVSVEIGAANTKSELVGEKTYGGNETEEEALPKKLKIFTGAHQDSGKQEDLGKMDSKVHSYALDGKVKISQNGGLSSRKYKTSFFGGYLLLDGLYQRCGIEQLASIRSSIQILK